ncbi:MAG: hypothetical protein JO122_21155 [Acetobacteraceae bacterium]|nr:hypothetical protein [Acetobacteraceae bacterium]
MPLGVEIASALGKAHGLGLIGSRHKPANILVDRSSGEVRVTSSASLAAAAGPAGTGPAGCTTAANLALVVLEQPKPLRKIRAALDGCN